VIALFIAKMDVDWVEGNMPEMVIDISDSARWHPLQQIEIFQDQV